MEILPRVLTLRRRRVQPVCWLQAVRLEKWKGVRMHHHKMRDLTSGSDYSVGIADPYTPSSDQAAPLDKNVVNCEFWGRTPADYVKWFNAIWNEGDATRWGPQVFTADAVMLDSAGLSVGADAAAADFLLLFRYFPDLRGEVVSWSRNDTEIFINWRFVVQKNRVCPVIDKFSFVDGLVSFRQAYFDTVMLLSYLSANYGSGPVVDYFVDLYWRRQKTGSGALFLPGLLLTFVRGAFLWSAIPPLPPKGLKATPRATSVLLDWEPVYNAVWYRVSRSTTPQGPYSWIAQTTQTQYEDERVAARERYYYRVSSHNTVAPIQTPPPPEPLPVPCSTDEMERI